MIQQITVSPATYYAILTEMKSYIEAEISSNATFTPAGNRTISLDVPCSCVNKCCYVSLFYALARTKLSLP